MKIITEICISILSIFTPIVVNSSDTAREILERTNSIQCNAVNHDSIILSNNIDETGRTNMNNTKIELNFILITRFDCIFATNGRNLTFLGGNER